MVVARPLFPSRAWIVRMSVSRWSAIFSAFPRADGELFHLEVDILDPKADGLHFPFRLSTVNG
jgi:hypothetical protein